jgi:hypothetical protein
MNRNRTNPSVQQRAAQPYAGVSRRVTAGVAAAVDGAFPIVFGWLDERGIDPSGPPFIRTRAIDHAGEPLELEMAVPVAEPAQANGEVMADVLPEGRYLTLLHVGPYRSETAADLADARDTLMEFARDNGLQCVRASGSGAELPAAVEHLLVGPVDTPDHTRWETELAYLIVD